MQRLENTLVSFKKHLVMVSAIKLCLFVFNQWDIKSQTNLCLNSNSVAYKWFYFGHVALSPKPLFSHLKE